MLSIRFYVGLFKSTDVLPISSKVIRRRRGLAKGILKDAYPALTFTNATGVWEGQTEPTLVAEVIEAQGDSDHHPRVFASRVAGILARDLHQECVMVTYQEVTQAVVSASPKEGE